MRTLAAGLPDFIFVPIADQDSWWLATGGHLVDLCRGSSDPAMMLPGPGEQRLVQARTGFLVLWISTQIDQLIRIAFQIKQQRAEAFGVDIFPTPVEDHQQARIGLVDFQRQP